MCAIFCHFVVCVVFVIYAVFCRICCILAQAVFANVCCIYLYMLYLLVYAVFTGICCFFYVVYAICCCIRSISLCSRYPWPRKSCQLRKKTNSTAYSTIRVEVRQVMTSHANQSHSPVTAQPRPFCENHKMQANERRLRLVHKHIK